MPPRLHPPSQGHPEHLQQPGVLEPASSLWRLVETCCLFKTLVVQSLPKSFPAHSMAGWFGMLGRRADEPTKCQTSRNTLKQIVVWNQHKVCVACYVLTEWSQALLYSSELLNMKQFCGLSVVHKAWWCFGNKSYYIICIISNKLAMYTLRQAGIQMKMLCSAFLLHWGGKRACHLTPDLFVFTGIVH